METTGLFWANESAIKEHQVSVFSLSDVGDIRVCARLHESHAKLAIASPFFMFSQH